jgi:O-antigen/teichoic acid export membrane protein
MMRNATSSMFALVWLNLLSILAIPLYIKILGVSEWGIVAACVSLQIIANFVDAGFSQIVPRWIAREVGNRLALHSLIVVFSKIYSVLALSILLFLQLAANYLSHDWFDIEPQRADRLELAIRVVALQIFFQFLNNLPIGFWHGTQQQVIANFRTCMFGTLKHVITMAVLLFFAAEAYAYAMCFAIIAMAELFFNGSSLWRILRPQSDEKIVSFNPMSFLREVSVLSSAIMVGLLVSQIDRVVLSRSVPIELFGIYSVIIAVSMAFLQLQIPFTRAYLPIFAEDYKKHGAISLIHIKKLVIITSVAAVLPAMIASAFAGYILQIWLGDSHIVKVGTHPLQLLLLAVAVNSLYGCVYQVIIASGKSHIVLKFNLVALSVALLVVAIAGTSKGLMLGGIIWLSTTITQLVLGMGWLALTYQKMFFIAQKASK